MHLPRISPPRPPSPFGVHFHPVGNVAALTAPHCLAPPSRYPSTQGALTVTVRAPIPSIDQPILAARASDALRACSFIQARAIASSSGVWLASDQADLGFSPRAPPASHAAIAASIAR